MKKQFKRILALTLALVMCMGVFTTLSLTASAATTGEVYLPILPRGDDPNKTGWGHPALTFANGWHTSAATYTTVKSIDGYQTKTVYCIEPGVPLNTEDVLNQKGEDFWDDYPENLNNSLESYQIKQFIGRIFVYGWTGNNNLSWNSANPVHAQEIANALATQYLVWETVVGDRDSNFNWVAAPNGTNNIMAMLASNHPLRSEILAHYDRIVASVKNHVSRPSFLSGNLAGASTHDFAWDGSKYSVTLTDNNNLLGNFTFSSTTPGVSFSVSGNKLTISTTTPPTGTIDITANKSGNVRKTTVVWTDYIMSNKTNGQIQDLISYGADVADPVNGYVRLKVSLGSLAIIKTTQNNGGAVDGFQFEVRNSAGTLIGTYTSTASGKIDIPNLQPGTYSVKEVNLSTDFVVPTPNPKSVTINAGQTASVSFDNVKKRGVITVQKSDANPTMGGYSLAGAIFEVRDQGGTLVSTITTGADGRGQSGVLPLGVYRVKEITAPYGFVLDKNTHTATLSGIQGTDAIVYAPDVSVAEQPQVGRINIEKSNSTPTMGDYDLSNAVFEIKNSAGAVVDTLITNKDGKAQSKDLKLGVYTVSEKNAPYGYVLNATVFSTELKYAGQEETYAYSTVAVPERPQTGIIRVHKQNANPNMGDYNLKDAVFEVRAAADIKQTNGKVIYNKGDLADTITTNTAGEAQTKELPLGAYTVREKTAPYGFVLNTNTYNPVLSYAGQAVTITYTDVTVPEQPQVGTITITKLDKVTGTRAQGDSTLKGAVYEVYAAADIKKLDGSFLYKKDQLADTLYCGNNNFATSKELPLGSYYYKEKVPPVGYTLDSASYPVTIEYQGQNVSVVKKYGDLKNKVVEGQIALVKHTDDPDPDVTPSDIQIEAPLEGAVFEVFLKSAGSYDKALATERDLLTTDADGYAKTKLLPYGIYTVKEISAAGLDVKLVKPFDVFISSEGKVYRYILDDPYFRSLVKVIKVDSETGKTIPAAGISFKVKDLSTGAWVVQHFNYPVPTDIDVFETAPDGTLVMPESLKSGDYELYEQAAPYGYVLTKEPVPFTIHSTQTDPAIAEVIMANNPQKGVITVEKVGNMLTGTSVTETSFGKQYTPIFSLTGLKGAVFAVVAAEDIYTPDGTLRYAKGTVVDTITTDSTGKAETKQLYLGNYTVIETKAPTDFVLDKTPHSVSLVCAGQEVAVTSSQIGIGNTRQTVEIDLQKLMEKPVNAPDDFSAFQDVIFGLFADQDIKGVNGETVIAKGSLIALMQIDENGKGVVTGELPFANYYVQELQTNIYYQLNSTKYPVTAEYKGQDVVTSKVQVNNGGIALPNELKLGQITVIKTGEMFVGATELEGKLESRYRLNYEVRGLSDVAFDVIAAQDIYDVYGKLIYKKGDVADTITTGTDGKAVTKFLHLGEYELVEKTVPFGYVSGTTTPVTLGFDGQVTDIISKTVSIFNERQKAEVTLDKVMEIPTDAPEGFNPYEDVRFGLYAKSDILSPDGEVAVPSNGLIEYVTVDADGHGVIASDLPFGSYYLKEQETAAGYVLDETEYPIVFDYDFTKGVLVEIAANNGEAIENRLQRGSLKVIKTFEGKETPIAGIRFNIVGETTVGTTVEIDAVTDENGEILLENLLVGNYSVLEIGSELTAGYVLSPAENAVVAADEIAEMTIENKLQRGDLRIIKTFEGVSTPIAGVKFTVTGTSIAGIPFEGEFETDANGVIEITGLPVGDYTVKEIGSDLTVGYVLSDEQTATVATDELTEMAIDNKLIRGNIKVLKTDADTGKPLAGAVFGLYKNGELIMQETTGEDGIAAFNDIAYGEYEIREISAPTGYVKTDAVFKVSIQKNGETVTVEATNKLVPPPGNPPKTGDDSNMALYLILMGVSAAALVGLTVAGKRGKRKENKEV
ncbi:MAG: sortase B protein-sorting domain-containing protein [Oscillospiraceae bacterium]|jgi:uncharacterized surface anchored protein|nr:sortase B protein-sorting domain-containing protein [Oscillospiraceae bacterium]